MRNHDDWHEEKRREVSSYMDHDHCQSLVVFFISLVLMKGSKIHKHVLGHIILMQLADISAQLDNERDVTGRFIFDE
jgi:hypothetical protein